MNENNVKVGISSCLLGEKVRFDGGHSQSKYCLHTLSEFFKFRQFCPEISAGLGTPRPAIRLYGEVENPKLFYSNNPGEDLREKLESGYARFIKNQSDLCGYILMKNSPSCGMTRIKVYQKNGYPHVNKRSGLFAQALMEQYPNLPVEEDGRLNDEALRENFIMRVFAYHRLKQLKTSALNLHQLIQFHSRYKYIVMAHSQVAYLALGQLLNGSSELEIGDLFEEYTQQFMQAIAKPATRLHHYNTLQHITGYLKKSLSPAAKADIVNILGRYRNSEVNLATPLSIINHYIKQFGSEYIQNQYYLNPYPEKLGLQNYI
ncbi:MAG: YbgA family protein [Marinicellaceae bacterium]